MPDLPEWNVEDALRSLEIERTVHGDLTSEQIAKNIFDENLVPAALAIVHLAQHSPNEKMRMDAAKYVLERIMGRIGDPPRESAENPLEKLLADIVDNKEA